MARYALIIGIAEYMGSFKSLETPVQNANAIAEILDRYGDFNQVRRLPFRREAGQKDLGIVIRKPLPHATLVQELQQFLQDANGSDVLLYYSGHGFTKVDPLSNTPEGFLAPSDCQVELNAAGQIVAEKNGISLSGLNALINRHAFNSLVVVLDCCNAGAFLESSLVRRDVTAFGYERDYYLITACRSSSKAYEGEEYSLLTAAVLKGLAQTNAAPSSGRISGDRLFDVIGNELQNSRQEPIRMGWGRLITLVRYLQPPQNPESGVQAFNPANPYMGLKPFEREQAAYFFGREQAVRALLDRLAENRFLAVIGPSGCGKSSLVKAGLLPELERDRIPGSRNWQVEIITPGQYPLQALTNALERHRSDAHPLVLFVDQFEELFTLCLNEEEQRTFIKRLDQETNDPDQQTRIIIALRGDFLDRCAKFQESADLINTTAPTTYIVTPLTEAKLVAELEESITCPAGLHGVSFEQGLVARIVDDVINQPGAMPLLQYALTQLWDTCISPNGAAHLLTIQSYDEIEGVKGALQRWADQFYTNLSANDQTFVREMVGELVQLGDDGEVTRRRASWERLRELASSQEQLDRIIGRLVYQRLLVADDKTVEVAHEALLRESQLIQGWIEENRDSVRLQQRLETYRRDWEEHDRSEDYLLDAGRLAAIDEWIDRKQPRLTNVDQEFIGKSRERRDLEHQQQLEQERNLREAAEARAKAEEEARQKADEVAIAESETRKAAEKALQAEQKRLNAEQQRTRFAIALAVITVFSAFGVMKWRDSDWGQISASTLLAKAMFATNRDTLDATFEALKAGKRLQESFWFRNDPQLQAEVKEALAETTNWVREYNHLEHKNFVWAVKFSPDGKTLATGGQDNTLQLWSPEGEKRHELKDHTDAVTGIDFSREEKHNGNFLATCSKDGTIKVRDSRTGKVLKSQGGHGSTAEHKDPLWRVRFSPDAKTVVAVSEAGYITLWNWQSDRPPEIWKGHSGTAYDVDFSPDGQTIATAGDEGVIKLWTQTQQGKLQESDLSGHTQAVTTVRFSPIGTTLASGSKDAKVILWNWKKRAKLKTLQGPSQSLRDVQFSRNGQQIVASGDDAVIFLWNQNGDPVTTFARHQEQVTSISLSPDGQRLASASADSTVKLWQIQPHIRELKEYSQAVYMVSIKPPDGQLFATDGEQNSVKLWRLDGTSQSSWQEPNPVYSIDFSPKKNMIAVTSGQQVNLRNLQGQLLGQPIAQHNGPVLGVSFSPDGQLLATSSADGLAKLWKLSGQFWRVLRNHTKPVHSVRFSPDGQTIATASWDGTVKLWNTQGELKRSIQASDSQVYRVGFSANSQVIATVGQSPLVKLWKLDGTPLATLEGHTKAVMDISFSPNDQLIATGSNDGTIKLWNRDGKLSMTLLRQDQPINALSFTPDSRWIIAASGNKEVLLIDVNVLTIEGLMHRGCNQLQHYKVTEQFCKN